MSVKCLVLHATMQLEERGGEYSYNLQGVQLETVLLIIFTPSYTINSIS